MNLDSMVRQGNLAWRPNAQAVDIDVWHRYEIPMSGVFRMGAEFVLFTMVYEDDHGTSVWAYLRLDEDDTRGLSGLEFASLEDMTAWVEHRFSGHEAVLALAREGRIATTWTRLVVEGDLLAAADRFLSLIVRSVDEVETDRDARIRAKMAGVDAARDELPERKEMIEV